VKLLVPIDDSEPSHHACRLAAQFAQEVGDVEVVLLNVRSLPEDYGGVALLEHDLFDRSLREGQQRLLAQRVGLTKVTIHAAQGAAAEEIVRVAKEKGVDQILMGTHGRGTVGMFLMGSVAQRVVHLAPMPVTLVK
jgi:nucleotide-binding universal stress UspA family protein